MARVWFSRKMLSTVLFVSAGTIFVIVLAVYSAIQFFEAGQTREQIMYAALFTASAQFVGGVKILAGRRSTGAVSHAI